MSTINIITVAGWEGGGGADVAQQPLELRHARGAAG